MNYSVGSTGRIAVARFDDGDDIIGGLVKIAKDENIRSALVCLVGGVKGGRFVTGPATEDLPPKPVWDELTESHESLGVGTIFWEGDTPKVHMHGAYGKHSRVKMGCLREKSECFLVLEAVIIEIKGIDARRELDPKAGLALLKL